MFTIDELREIIKMVEQSSLQRFELEQDAARLVLVKNETAKMTQLKVQPDNKEQPNALNIGNDIPVIPAVKQADLHQIVSPVVGTFYAAPEPGAEPFVKVAQQVTSNTVVGIVEVMKLFNEVEAGVNGEIAEILVQDGQFVEYGQPLFLIKVKDEA